MNDIQRRIQQEIKALSETTAARLTDAQLARNEETIQRNLERLQDPTYREYHRQKCLEVINNPGYINPQGMLGKKRSEQTRQKASKSLQGKAKPLEGNKKISQARCGIARTQEEKQKLKQSMIGKSTTKTRSVRTPAGIFNRIKDAAKHYGVTPGAIKLWIMTKPNEFAWNDQAENLQARRIQTPDGIFENVNKAAEYYQITVQGARYRCKIWPNWNYIDHKGNYV